MSDDSSHFLPAAAPDLPLWSAQDEPAPSASAVAAGSLAPQARSADTNAGFSDSAEEPICSLTGRDLAAFEPDDYRRIAIPERIQRLIRLHAENLPTDAEAVIDHILAAAQDFEPKDNTDWIEVTQIGYLGYEIVTLTADAERLLKLQRPQAVRETLKPGWSHHQPGGSAYDSKHPDAEANEVTIDGKTVSLSLACDAETEQRLEAAARLGRGELKLGAAAIGTQALRLCLDEYQTLKDMIASAQGRRQALITEHLRRRQVMAQLRSAKTR